MKKAIGKKQKKQYDRFMSISELKEILEYFKRTKQYKYYLLFLTQSSLSLRISETVAIQVKDIKFKPKNTTIQIRLAKTDRIIIKKVPEKLAILWQEYIIKYKEHIINRDYYLFYSFNPRCSKGHISKKMGWLKIREAVKNIWGSNYDTYQDVKNNKYRIGTHSLRRLSITRLLKISKNIFFVQDWVGHSDVKITQKYLNYSDLKDNQELYINDLFKELQAIP